MKKTAIFDHAASPKAMLPVALATALLMRRRKGSGRLALGTSIAVLTEEIVKRLVSRRRPKLFFDPRRRSFPSGHSASSAAYLIGLALMAPRSFRRTALVFAGLSEVAINFLRVKEREHWITDVMAGDFIGGLSVAGAHAVVAGMARTPMGAADPLT